MRCLLCGSDEMEVKKLHRFPSNLEKSKKWLENLGIIYNTEDNLRNYRICNNHFKKDSYFDLTSYRLLKDAVPIPWLPCTTPNSEMLTEKIADKEQVICQERITELNAITGPRKNPVNWRFDDSECNNKPETIAEGKPSLKTKMQRPDEDVKEDIEKTFKEYEVPDYNEIEIVDINDIKSEIDVETNQECLTLPCQIDQYTPSHIDEPKTQEISEKRPSNRLRLKKIMHKSRPKKNLERSSKFHNWSRQFEKKYKEKKIELIIKDQERRRIYEERKINLLQNKNCLLEGILNELRMLKEKLIE